MRALVVFESMYGNTRSIAHGIAHGLDAAGIEVTASPVGEMDGVEIEQFDLLVVGGPTHVRGMSRPSTRADAAEKAGEPGSGLTLDPGPNEPGIRGWLETLGTFEGRVAAFDTRVDMSPVLTGRASKGIGKALRRLGATEAVPSESFLVTKQNRLVEGEVERALTWGSALADALNRQAA